ncbi:MAG: response regulator [Burkholderiales bacterium]
MPESVNSLSPLAHKRVLIVDRHAHVREKLSDMCDRLGAASVAAVATADTAHAAMKEHSADVFLCDYQLEETRTGQAFLEELRTLGALDRDAVFVMVTSERTYRRVRDVAEFAPDAYLLKPFTIDTLAERLMRAVARKRVFAPVHELLELGQVDGALVRCQELIADSPSHAPLIERLQAEILVKSGRYAQAESLLSDILEHRVAPWACVALSRAQVAQGRLEEAEGLLLAVSARHADYMQAYDLLADVKSRLGKPSEALAVLEASGVAAAENLDRLRRAGSYADAAGRHEQAARMYLRAVDRARGSPLASAADYLCLARAYSAQGKAAQAERVASDHRRDMCTSPEGDLVACLIAYRVARLRAEGPASEEAREALDRGLVLRDAATSTFSYELELDLLDALIEAGRGADADYLGSCMIGRPDLNQVALEQIRSRLARLGLAPPRVEAIVPVDQLLPMLGKLAARGWDDALGGACRASIGYWAAAIPGDVRLDPARVLMGQLLALREAAHEEAVET